MGLDVYGGLVLGMPVTREDFWRVTGTVLRCDRCRRPPSIEAQFCPTCGGKVVADPEAVPASALVKYAAAHAKSPSEVWEMLWEAEPRDIGVRRINSIQGDESDPALALGCVLAQSRSHRHDAGLPLPVTLEDARDCEVLVRAMADGLGLDPRRPVNLYPFIRLSC